jgi:hypothetical protein
LPHLQIWNKLQSTWLLYEVPHTQLPIKILTNTRTIPPMKWQKYTVP